MFSSENISIHESKYAQKMQQYLQANFSLQNSKQRTNWMLYSCLFQSTMAKQSYSNSVDLNLPQLTMEIP